MKILVIQNRKGIGDTVIFLPYIKALFKKFNSPISLLVKENSKADQFLFQTNYIDKILLLERDKRSNSKHDGFFGSLNLIKDIKKYNFDKIIIFNSSFRFYLIAKFSNISEIYQYPLFKKNQQHITETPRKFMKDKFNLYVDEDPEIQINHELILQSSKKFQINKNELNILLGIGGSGPTKRIPAKIFIDVIKMMLEKKKCKFFLATGKDNDEQLILNEILESKYKNFCVPLDNLSIKETLPIIKNCNLSICNDSSFSHLSAALGIKTITLMADTPLVYGNYSSIMFPIIPEGEKTVTHDTLGKEKISSRTIVEKIIEILD
ncbi:glycosyltransferase family 9 protein [Pelagibacterales bacterium SAG-MED19]|nr:glycosyltransferase family 9 protein [Pelagibacterales bacterium SAG-MED19]